MKRIHGLLIFFIFLSTFLSACQFTPFPQEAFDEEASQSGGAGIEGEPSPGSRDIYASANLNQLCVDTTKCEPLYEKLSAALIRTAGQEPLINTTCNFDFDANLVSTFLLHRVEGSVNGLKLLLSKEDLFFLAWSSVRYQINPYFLLGVMAAESAGNCAAVSTAHAEGCFQITNTFGQAQLKQSYPDRVKNWFWSDRSGNDYPDSIFVDDGVYFGENPSTDQFRLTEDPTSGRVDNEEVSSVVNFHFGILASSFYFKWQHYLLYYHYASLRETAAWLFQSPDGKGLWQAAAYNGGSYGAAQALSRAGSNFLGEMREETQNYAQNVMDYCHSFQAGDDVYSAVYEKEDVAWILDLLSFTYPEDSPIDWEEVKEDVNQVFFSDGNQTLTFEDDIKALVYVISTHVPELAPEWPEEDSI